MEVNMAYYKCHRDGIPHPVDTVRRLSGGEVFQAPSGSIPVEDFANGFFELLPNYIPEVLEVSSVDSEDVSVPFVSSRGRK